MSAAIMQSLTFIIWIGFEKIGTLKFLTNMGTRPAGLPLIIYRLTFSCESKRQLWFLLLRRCSVFEFEIRSKSPEKKSSEIRSITEINITQSFKDLCQAKKLVRNFPCIFKSLKAFISVHNIIYVLLILLKYVWLASLCFQPSQPLRFISGQVYMNLRNFIVDFSVNYQQQQQTLVLSPFWRRCVLDNGSRSSKLVWKCTFQWRWPPYEIWKISFLISEK